VPPGDPGQSKLAVGQEDLRGSGAFWFLGSFLRVAPSRQFPFVRVFRFAVLEVLKFLFFQFLNFDFRVDPPARPLGADSDVTTKTVWVCSAERRAARRRRPAHTCLLRQKLHAVDVLSF
jgi:hypothetical protein